MLRAPCLFQCLRKVAKFVLEQNEKVFAPRGLLLTDPTERGLRVVSFLNRLVSRLVSPATDL